MTRTPSQSIDVDSGEYQDGAAWRQKGGAKRDNPYGPGVQWVNWQAGFLGLTPEEPEKPRRKR